MDILNLQKALDKFNDESLPQIEVIVTRLEKLLVQDVQAILDRVDGTRVTVAIPPRVDPLP
jgi:hypothetical protein